MDLTACVFMSSHTRRPEAVYNTSIKAEKYPTAVTA